MAAIDNIGKTVPNVILDTVIFKDNRVELKMHIKEYLYADGTGTWVTNDLYKEKLQVRIKVRTEKGEKSDVTTAFLTPASRYESLELEKEQKIHFTYVLKKEVFSNLFKTWVKQPSQLQIPNTELTQQTTLKSFDCEQLTISAETFISRSKLSNINFGAIPFVELAGATSSVEVVKDSNPLVRTTGYFLNNAFYTGPKTQLTNGRWVTGNARNESSEFLVERDVPNIKVMDVRNIFSSATVVEAQIENQIANIAKNSQSPYFSQISSTRDTNGFLRFFFTFDYRRAYSEKSLYGTTFDNLSETLQDRVLKMSTIQTLSLKRARAGSSFTDLPVETVVTSGEASGDRFVDINNDNAALKEEEFNFQKGTLYLRTFSGVDKLFKDISSGKYKYSTDITFKDGIYKFLAFQAEDLRKSTAILQKYIDSVETIGNSNFLLPSFKERVKEENDFLNRPYIRALVSLSENIYFYKTNLHRRLIRTLRSWLSPTTGTTEDLNNALSLMISIQGMLENLMATVRGANVSEATTQGMPRGNMIYNVSETFTQEFNAADSFKNGLTFLSAKEILEPEDPDGLVKITARQFESRIEDESINFFKSKTVTFNVGTADASISSTSKTTSFTYLTPTAVRLNDQIYAVGTVKGLKQTAGLDITSLSLGDSKNKYKTVLSKLRSSKITDTGIGSEVLDISPVSDPGFEHVVPEWDSANPPPPNPPAVSFGDSINAGSYDNPFNKLKIIGTSPQGDSMIISNISGEHAEISRDQFELLPNYFKAILTGAQSFGDSFSQILAKADTGDIDPYSLIIGSTVKIEVLIDFNKNSEPKPKDLVRDPNWVPLTYELYRNYPGTNFLCRLTKYDNSALGFKRSNTAAVFNHFFVLESPVISNIYGPDGGNLQSDINGARSLEDLIGIFSAYGVEYDPNTTPSQLDANGCAVLMDERMIEEVDDA